MKLTIHKGTNQIGGCVTEISTENARVFIDLGADLIKDKDKANSKIYIDGLTTGNAKNSFLLITHYHGDHIGRIDHALPGIPIYMGETAREISMAIAKRTNKKLELLEKTQTFRIAGKFKLGDIKVTPFMIDHSAFDAYSFLIEADGKRIFYTGDFRLHGPRGRKMLENGFFEKHATNIDYLICEGTNISKLEKAQTEVELRKDAAKLFENPKHKYVFVLCSSVNIDRIFEFYHAYDGVFKRKRPFLCDYYQEDVLKIVSEKHGKKSDFYNFTHNCASRKDGFCLLIRNERWKKTLDKYFTKYPDECLLIYSKWDGYISENKEVNDPKLIEFLKPYNNIKRLHTSGHADVETLQKVEGIIKPKHIIPIHTEKPEMFQKLFKNTLLLKDGVPYEPE
jgi:ribonuclease J